MSPERQGEQGSGVDDYSILDAATLGGPLNLQTRQRRQRRQALKPLSHQDLFNHINQVAQSQACHRECADPDRISRIYEYSCLTAYQQQQTDPPARIPGYCDILRSDPSTRRSIF